MNIGKNIKLMRIKADMQQVELAQRLGISQSMLSQIERGTKACTMQMGAEIAEILGCKIGDLLADENKPA